MTNPLEYVFGSKEERMARQQQKQNMEEAKRLKEEAEQKKKQDESDAANIALQDAARKRARATSGGSLGRRSGTLLTGPRGIEAPTSGTGPKTLLGY